MPDDLRIEVSHAAGIPIVSLIGRPDLRDAARIMAVLDQHLRAQAYGTMVCDSSRMAPPHTEALLTVFPAALRRAGGWPCHNLRLAAPGPDLARALTRVRMHRYVPVHPDLADALTAARHDTAFGCRKIRLMPDPSSSRAARALLQDIPDGISPVLRADAALVISELANNAVRHVAAPFELAVAVSPEQVLIAATDPSRTEPILRPQQNTAVSGRGMQLVAALSRNWGVRLIHQGGKVVWAALDDSATGPAVVGA